MGTPTHATAARPRSRRGAAIIYAVVIMSVLIGVASLAVDYGKAQLVRSELQAAADGAARAAASGLSTSVAEAKKRARDLAAMNRAEGAAVTLAEGDFRFGKWDAAANRIDTGATPVDTVEVTARRTVSLAFGSMIGKGSTNVAARAAARAGSGAAFTGFSGLNSVYFKNNTLIGSYRSSVTTTPTQASSTGKGTVSSNGTVTFDNNATVHGDVVLGPSGSVVTQKNVTVTGATQTNPTTLTAPPDPPWDGSATNPNGVPKAYTVSNDTALPGGTYHFTSLTANKKLTFTGPATLYVNGNITTDDSIVTYQNKPANLTIYVLGTNRVVHLEKSMSLYAVVQAPGAALVANNNLSFYGRGIFKSIEAKNNADFFFDQDATGGAAGGGAITLVQ